MVVCHVLPPAFGGESLSKSQASVAGGHAATTNIFISGKHSIKITCAAGHAAPAPVRPAHHPQGPEVAQSAGGQALEAQGASSHLHHQSLLLPSACKLRSMHHPFRHPPVVPKSQRGCAVACCPAPAANLLRKASPAELCLASKPRTVNFLRP